MTYEDKNGFDPKAYWEHRLHNDFSKGGVGYLGLGIPYNNWLYKVRKSVFARIVKNLEIDIHSCDVLDVGSGTGFYIDLWMQAGVRNISGCDITSIAVQNLRRRLNSDRIYQVDIGGNLTRGPLSGKTYDIISAFDVLFHIVDDERHIAALRNIRNLLPPGGIFIFSDNYLHHKTEVGLHQISRSLVEVQEKVKLVGFEILDRKPMFVIMNYPIDCRSKYRKMGWKLYVMPASRLPLYGFIAGACAYPIELMLTSLLKESPSTEIMVCRAV